VETRSWPCPTCDEERVFVQPPCIDAHTEDGAECPEWACADCGTALLAGEPVAVAALPLRRAA
jgi:hypothetical protein